MESPTSQSPNDLQTEPPGVAPVDTGLLAAAVSTSVCQFAYDGLGDRIRETGPSGSQTYTDTVVASGDAMLYLKANVSGTLTKTAYLYAGGLLIASLSGSTFSYVREDVLGDTRLVTQAGHGGSVNVVFSTNYLPFGVQYAASGTDPNVKYTGQWSEALGLYWDHARFYDPTLGRFVSDDPVLGHLSTPQTLDRYAYAVNDPMRFEDPSGRDCSWNPLSWGDCIAGAWNSAEAFFTSIAPKPPPGMTNVPKAIFEGPKQIIGGVLTGMNSVGSQLEGCLSPGHAEDPFCGEKALWSGWNGLPGDAKAAVVLGGLVVGGVFTFGLDVLPAALSLGSINLAISHPNTLAGAMIDFEAGALGGIIGDALGGYDVVSRLLAATGLGGAVGTIVSYFEHGFIDLTQVLGTALIAGVGEYVGDIIDPNSAIGDLIGEFASDTITATLAAGAALTTWLSEWGSRTMPLLPYEAY